MNILDILIAKKQSFTAETERLTKQAKAAIARANEVTAKIDEAQDALDAAEAANTRAQEIAENLDELQEDINTAVDNVIDDKIDAAISSITSSVTEAQNAAAAAQTAAANAVTNVDTTDTNTSTVKTKKIRVEKNGVQQTYDITKNYTSTGSNEDGSMTQKAITNALAAQKSELETKINRIPSGGGSGNISGNLSPEDEGKLVTVGTNGNLKASAITENDILTMQLTSDSYQNDSIVGLEIDYINKTYTRLQGAKNLNAGPNFNKYSMYGGRRRCIVDASGQIVRFISSNENPDNLLNERIMVYQPAFYYMRVIKESTSISAGLRVDKEQLYLSDKQFAGFKIHPLFTDAEGNELKYALLPAFECSGYRTQTDVFEKTDPQDLDLENDCLVSAINAYPISGSSQNFNFNTAKIMAENNGEGWCMTDLRFESAEQMLMMVEFGSLNIQNLLGAGMTKFNETNNIPRAITGSTLTLGNYSGTADTTYATNNSFSSQNGYKAISYRGIENPYGSTWHFINNAHIDNYRFYYKDNMLSFALPTTNDWIAAFGFDAEYDWIYIPIEIGSKGNSALPVGDYFAISNKGYNYCIVGNGTSISQEKAGIFYYSFSTEYTHHGVVFSARVMHLPVANSTTETINYNLWRS